MNVNCEEARLQIGADPRASSAELRQHLLGCGECARHQSEMAALEVDLRKALALGPVLPAGTSERPLAPRRLRSIVATRVWAVAASLLLATLGGLVLWTASAGDSLARSVGDHVAHEPQSWAASQVLSREAVEAVLHRSHIELAGGQDQVVFAQTCYIRGKWLPHLVVRTAQGLVAVLILPDEPVSASRTFHEYGFTGVLLPAPRGSIAVLTQQASLSLDVAQQLRAEVRWLPDKPGPG
jgi:hypothetical protein